jgi:hypothetical protein
MHLDPINPDSTGAVGSFVSSQIEDGNRDSQKTLLEMSNQEHVVGQRVKRHNNTLS